VLKSLQGQLSSNTVNAPMVAPEVLKELAPFISLARGLGKVAVQLVAETGFSGAFPDSMLMHGSPTVPFTSLIIQPVQWHACTVHAI
jgi:hypothetical protein